jgi:hypothetical protein
MESIFKEYRFVDREMESRYNQTIGNSIEKGVCRA